jgi:Aminotransferase class-V
MRSDAGRAIATKAPILTPTSDRAFEVALDHDRDISWSHFLLDHRIIVDQLGYSAPTNLDAVSGLRKDCRPGTNLRAWPRENRGAGSRTHEFGQRAKRAVQQAREAVAAVGSADPDEVYFTSGATESNNLAILGLACHGESTNRRAC